MININWYNKGLGIGWWMTTIMWFVILYLWPYTWKSMNVIPHALHFSDIIKYPFWEVQPWQLFDSILMIIYFMRPHASNIMALNVSRRQWRMSYSSEGITPLLGNFCWHVNVRHDSDRINSHRPLSIVLIYRRAIENRRARGSIPSKLDLGGGGGIDRTMCVFIPLTDRAT